MKDALGHGSDGKGGPSVGVHGRYLIQKVTPGMFGAKTVLTVSGSASRVRPEAKAERIAMRMANDSRLFSKTNISAPFSHKVRALRPR